MSTCSAALVAKVAGASLLQSGQQWGESGPQVLQQTCPLKAPLRPDPLTRRAIDREVVCAVMCCCSANPNVGANEQNLQQSCADETFKAADILLKGKSRYKSEVSWNMQQGSGGEPTPFMHRAGPDGANTTEASYNWQTRARKEIENYQSGKGMVRRPDLVVVDNPCEPPGAGNTEAVYEFKFGNDPRDRDQDRAYKRIAGGDENYQVFRCGGSRQGEDEHVCACGEPEPERVPAPVTAPAPERRSAASRAKDVAAAVAWSAVTVAAALATVVAVASPFDGPVGDVAAGSATAAAAARAAATWRAVASAF